MSEGVSDSFAAILPAERCDLIRRLERPVENSRVAECRRRIRLRLLLAGVIVLIPWIVFLAFTLPASYIAHRWTATWVGFDILLLTLLVATAVLGWLRRQLLAVTAFTSGVLLICDAWFDIMTAGPDQMWLSVSSAVLLELPLAAVLIGRALHIVRLANAEAHRDLTASRARIVAAADEARRRLERDLHDGAQQRLVSVCLELRAAEASVPSDLPALKAQISDRSTAGR